MAQPPDPVTRINALTTNARNTWFILLGVLVFVAITLMGVQHIDFYGVDRATALPLVNVSVPTWLFFYAAPLLITAVYGYFHLYLTRLWDALGAADADIDNTPLGDAITPWLVTDAALHLRARLRGDNCTPPRVIEGPAALLNFLLAWIFGLGILYWLWVESMPARDFTMTLLAAICLLISSFVAYVSFRAMWVRMQAFDPKKSLGVKQEGVLIATLAFLLPTCVAVSLARTDGTIETLARIDLTGAAIVEKPAGWLPYDIARKDFLAQWCARETPACDPPASPQSGLIARLPAILFGEQGPTSPATKPTTPDAFETEWQTRRTAELAALKKPRWSAPNAPRPDFRGAALSESFLSWADLSRAQMEGADLSLAQMQGAVLRAAQMQGAVLRAAQMQGADLSWAQMQGADLSWAQMQGADLSFAQMQGADLIEAQMQGANLIWAQMQGANLIWAQMQEADLRWSLLTGSLETPSLLLITNLSASTNKGGALRFVDFSNAILDTRTDWRNVFLDASVTVPPHMRDRIGNPCLWNWIEKNPAPLSDTDFFGHWRGWLTLDPAWNDDYWESLVRAEWRDVPPRAPPANCTWQTDPVLGIPEPD